MKDKKISIKYVISGAAFVIWFVAFALASATMAKSGYPTYQEFAGILNGSSSQLIGMTKHMIGDFDCGYVTGILWILVFFVASAYFGSLFKNKTNLKNKRHLRVLSSILGVSALLLLISWASYANGMDIAGINDGLIVAYAVFGFFGMFAMFAMFHPWFNVGLPKICTKKQKKAVEQQPVQNN